MTKSTSRSQVRLIASTNAIFGADEACAMLRISRDAMDRKYRLERHPRSRLLEEAARRGPFDFAEYRRRKEGDS